MATEDDAETLISRPRTVGLSGLSSAGVCTAQAFEGLRRAFADLGQVESNRQQQATAVTPAPGRGIRLRAEE